MTDKICKHCKDLIPVSLADRSDFCCNGCEGAFALVNGLGLSRYYKNRTIDPEVRALRPDDLDQPVEYTSYARYDEKDGLQHLHLMVEGIHCAACVWLIESVLSKDPRVRQARVNMTTRRLTLSWEGEAADAGELVANITALGYRLVPFDPSCLADATAKEEKTLLVSMAVAGFAAANVMLFSVSVWSGHVEGMGWATRTFMHWMSALVGLPAIVFAGRPFFRSALQALRGGRANMDVPISIAVLLASGMSIYETAQGGEHAYFDSAIMLLFFLLIGRYMDHRARGRARGAAAHLLGLSAQAVTVLRPDGHRDLVPPLKVALGDRVLVTAGERIGVDGRVVKGQSDLDTSLISGESEPSAIKVGDAVFAGTLNLSAPIELEVTAVGESTLLGEIVRLMENAEQGRARYVALADRVARLYVPVVHSLAALAFLGWYFLGGMAWQDALLTAVSVLIITCPCALALAVPVVQVVASGKLMRQGILLKSGTALERLVLADTVVFDKTGTLTVGHPELVNGAEIAPADLELAASIAARSKHPLAKALQRAVPRVGAADHVEEVPGKGLRAGDVLLGSRSFVGEAEDGAAGPELWLKKADGQCQRFAFSDPIRRDAKEVLAALSKAGLELHLLSGDREVTVAGVAAELGLETYKGACKPQKKVEYLEALKAAGKRPIMVGDGLNDAPALAVAEASISPATAADVSQNAADVVFQGDKLGPVLTTLRAARHSDALVKQNLGIAFIYNAIAIPFALSGGVTPLIAAAAMSGSSIVVVTNALRFNRMK